MCQASSLLLMARVDAIDAAAISTLHVNVKLRGAPLVDVLADELLFRILTFLSAGEIGVIRRTCRELHAQSSGNSLWRYLLRRDFSIAIAPTHRELVFSGFGAAQTARPWLHHFVGGATHQPRVTLCSARALAPAHQCYVDFLTEINTNKARRRVELLEYERSRNLHSHQVRCMQAYDCLNAQLLNVLPPLLLFVQLLLITSWLDERLPSWSAAQVLFPSFALIALLAVGLGVQYMLRCCPLRCCRRVPCPAFVGECCTASSPPSWQAVRVSAPQWLLDQDTGFDEQARTHARSCCLDVCLCMRIPHALSPASVHGAADSLVRALPLAVDRGDAAAAGVRHRYECNCLCTGHWACQAVENRTHGPLPVVFTDRLQSNPFAHVFFGATLVCFIVMVALLLLRTGVIPSSLSSSASRLSYLLIFIPGGLMLCCLFLTPCAAFMRSGNERVLLLPLMCCLIPCVVSGALLASRLDGADVPLYKVFMPFFVVLGTVVSIFVCALWWAVLANRCACVGRCVDCSPRSVQWLCGACPLVTFTLGLPILFFALLCTRDASVDAQLPWRNIFAPLMTLFAALSLLCACLHCRQVRQASQFSRS